LLPEPGPGRIRPVRTLALPGRRTGCREIDNEIEPIPPQRPSSDREVGESLRVSTRFEGVFAAPPAPPGVARYFSYAPASAKEEKRTITCSPSRTGRAAKVLGLLSVTNQPIVEAPADRAADSTSRSKRSSEAPSGVSSK